MLWYVAPVQLRINSVRGSIMRDGTALRKSSYALLAVISAGRSKATVLIFSRHLHYRRRALPALAHARLQAP